MESSVASVGSAVTATAETTDEIFIDIKAKVKEVIPDRLDFYLEKIDFELDPELLRDMKLLLGGVTEPLRLDKKIDEEGLSEPLGLGEKMDEEDTHHKLSILRLGESASEAFLQCLEFPNRSKVVYFRHFYEKLYQVLLKHWSSPKFALLLIGNSGTGKSWFQAYALRRLAQQDSTYKFVVRQVEGTYFLHDLTTHNVYKIKYDYNDDIALKYVVNGMTETVYFFEPGREKGIQNRSPDYFTIPSLSTLSPNPVRIKVYIKHDTVIELFFPVWSGDEYAAVGQNQEIAVDDIKDRYYRFGGILRHLFLDKIRLQRELEEHLGTQELKKILLTEVTDVGRVTENGNASGYLVSYTDISFVGDQAFKSRKLMLTSVYVREKIRENMNLVTAVDWASMVLKVLRGRGMVDLGGSCLECTVATMIAGGSGKTEWEAREVGTAEWKDHKLNKAEVVWVEKMEISHSKKARVLFVSLNRNFPVVDIVKSQRDEDDAVTAYQVTWQGNHPFKMGTLCDLRKKLEIGSEGKLKIFFVVPKKEETYANLQKEKYWKDYESIDWRADKNEEIYNNTFIYVLKPKEKWDEAIQAFVFTKRKRGQD